MALALLSSADETEGFHIHKLEYIEPEQVNQAVLCMRKLRTLSKRVRSLSTDKRTHSHALGSDDLSPAKLKKARCLQASPTDAGLPDSA